MYTVNFKIPTSVRVIGVGIGVKEIINKVKSVELEGVSTEISEYPYECIPSDEDKLAIIIFTDLEENANRIDKTFHNAGILTIGFSEDADPSCYDNIMLCDSRNEYPDIIKALLQPILTQGNICYYLSDLYTMFRNTGYFTVKTTTGNNAKDAIEKLKAIFNELELNSVDNLTINIYFNPNGSTPLKMSDLASLSEMMSTLPEKINVIWSINHDENLNENDIRLTTILTGKDVCNIL